MHKQSEFRAVMEQLELLSNPQTQRKVSSRSGSALPRSRTGADLLTDLDGLRDEYIRLLTAETEVKQRNSEEMKAMIARLADVRRALRDRTEEQRRRPADDGSRADEEDSKAGEEAKSVRRTRASRMKDSRVRDEGEAIGRLRVDPEVLRAENQRLKADLEVLRAENQRLKADLEVLRPENRRLKADLEVLRAENQRLTDNLQVATLAKENLGNELREAGGTICQQQRDLGSVREERDELTKGLRDSKSQLAQMIEAKEEADQRRISAQDERDRIARRFEQERADNAKLRQEAQQSRRELSCCEHDRNTTKTMLITQMNRLREANERRFTRIRQLHSEELRTLIATYESRV